MTVALVVPEEYSFPDNWIYIHDPGVKVGRIQNFGSWSPYLVKEGRTCLGLEFFVNEGDDMWTKSDEDLIEQGKRELAAARARRREQGRGRLRGADAEGVSGLRRVLQGQRRRSCASGSREHAPNVYADGPQRHAQVQQPGPLDVDGDALGRQHLRRPQRRLVGERRGPSTTRCATTPRPGGDDGTGERGTGRDAPVLPARGDRRGRRRRGASEGA